MKPGRLIYRYEHNYFRGWVVSIKRGGRRMAKYFSDKPDGPNEALRRACEYRDRQVDRLPPPVKIKRTYVLNKTGEIGVTIAKEISRSGTLFMRYIATWPGPANSRLKVTFSFRRYGRNEAKRLAVQARRRGVVKYKAYRRKEAKR